MALLIERSRHDHGPAPPLPTLKSASRRSHPSPLVQHFHGVQIRHRTKEEVKEEELLPLHRMVRHFFQPASPPHRFGVARRQCLHPRPVVPRASGSC